MKVKICGLTRTEDVELAIDLGADALGFVFDPKSPRFLDRDRRHLITAINPYVLCVAVYGQTAEMDTGGCNALQLVELGSGTGLNCPQALPSLIKTMRPRSSDPTVLEFETKEWLSAHSDYRVRAILLDAFDESSYGGTGKCVDWTFAADFALLSPKPVILAGGLTPDNVADAMQKVKPYAVDVSSGVEASPGIKDPIKMRDFIQAAKAV